MVHAHGKEKLPLCSFLKSNDEAKRDEEQNPHFECVQYVTAKSQPARQGEIQ